jgi:aspartate 1-decarboxylase
MNRTMLRSKIHRIRVTACDVEYVGSLTLDPELMDAADFLPYERIEVYNIDNANRFATYLIEGQRGSGECCVNGAAAHLVTQGDKLILASYTTVRDERAPDHRPTVVLVGADNRVREVVGTSPEPRV